MNLATTTNAPTTATTNTRRTTTARWLTLAAIVGCAGLLAATRPEQPVNSYCDASTGLRFAPPRFDCVEPMKATSDGERATRVLAQFFAPSRDGFAANMNVQLQPTSLEAFKEASSAQWKAGYATLVEERSIELAGRTGVEYRYRATMMQRDLEFLAIALPFDDGVLVATCTGLASRFAEDEPAFRASLASIELPAR
jgi:hypothetical protein